MPATLYPISGVWGTDQGERGLQCWESMSTWHFRTKVFNGKKIESKGLDGGVAQPEFKGPCSRLGGSKGVRAYRLTVGNRE